MFTKYLHLTQKKEFLKMDFIKLTIECKVAMTTVKMGEHSLTYMYEGTTHYS